MRCILTFSLFCFIGSLLSSQPVIWQHGLGSDSDFWQQAANQFEDERSSISRTINRSINTRRGVEAMARDIVNATSFASSPGTIGIGHSMGGVAFREIAADLNPSQFDGIVTVGSPLNGAYIANAIRDGRFDSFMTNGINELQKGPRRSRLGLIAIIGSAEK